MNRLAVRLTVFIVTAMASTIALLVAIEMYNMSRQYESLPVGFRDGIERVVDDPNFSKEEQLPRLKALFQELTSSDENFERFLNALLNILNGRLRSLLLAALVTVPFGVLVALLIARHLSKPITNVSHAARRVAHGDLSARVVSPSNLERSGGEIGELTHNFNAMAESLERLERERQAMIADIAHELRTPLTILQGHIDAMEDGILPLDHDSLGTLTKQTQLLSRLVTDLRTLSLADAGRLSLERREVDLSELVRECSAAFAGTARAKGVVIKLELPGALYLNADPDRLLQVMGNLLSNALRHTPVNGAVTLHVARVNEEAHLRVADSGSGLSEEALGRVFNRFYRADASRGRTTGGSGLGLAIVRALIELHDGRVWATNSAEGGAVFGVALPLEVTPPKREKRLEAVAKESVFKALN